jgi:hypothetical protein
MLSRIQITEFSGQSRETKSMKEWVRRPTGRLAYRSVQIVANGSTMRPGR